MPINHQNNFATTLTSNTTAGATTSPLNSIPTIDAPFYIAFDATNINGHYEVLLITSKTATNVNHSATSYDHSTDEEVRNVVPAEEFDAISASADGWTSVSDSWSYASATTITVPSGAASIYAIGDSIKLTQTTVKYFKIVGVADTVLTVTGGSDYTVANAAITNIYHSHQSNPLGFPQWFNYTPTGPTNTTLTGKFNLNGRIVFCQIRGAVTGTPSFSNMPTLPITAGANILGSIHNSGAGYYYDDGVGRFYNGVAPDVVANGTVCTLYDTAGTSTAISNTNPITWQNGDEWGVHFWYEI